MLERPQLHRRCLPFLTVPFANTGPEFPTDL